MDTSRYAARLRDLVKAYLAERICRVEYLAQRRRLLDGIDRECNGEEVTQGPPDLDVTRPVHPKRFGSQSDKRST